MVGIEGNSGSSAFKQRYGIEVTWNDLGSGATAVSYTHLDVYKRQILGMDPVEHRISLGIHSLGNDDAADAGDTQESQREAA